MIIAMVQERVGCHEAEWKKDPAVLCRYGKVYTSGGATAGRAAGIPFAVIAYSGHVAYSAEAHGYRYDRHDHNNTKGPCPRSAYCFVPMPFPEFEVQDDEPITMAHFKLNEADFVVDALHTLSTYVQARFDFVAKEGQFKDPPAKKKLGHDGDLWQFKSVRPRQI